MKKLSWKKIGCLLLAMLMMATMLATGVVAWDNVGQQKGSITIHKYEQMDPGENQDWPTGEQGNGTSNVTVPDNAKPLNGAEFTVYLLNNADVGKTELEAASSVEAFLEQYGAKNKEGQQISFIKTTANDATLGNGIAQFTNLALGRYLVVETQKAPNTTRPTPSFFVDVPMTNPDGNGWNYNVHVFPKNALVRGTVELTKFDENDHPLPGAVFALYMATKDANDNYTKLDELFLGAEPGNPSTSTGPDYTSKAYTVSNDSGKVSFTNIPVGHYILKEVAAPSGYTLSTVEYPFTITATNPNYKFESMAINYKQLDDTAFKKENVGITGARDINWRLTAPIPGDITLYKTFKISDTLPTELGTAGDITKLTVKVGETTLIKGTDYTVAVDPENAQKFTIDLIKAKESNLTPSGQVIVTFTTTIIDGAEVGTKTNKATLIWQSETGDPESKEVSATANIYGIDVTKVNLTGKKLINANFALYDADPSAMTEEQKAEHLVYERTVTDEETGTVRFSGLNAGEYWLVETKAPDGYALLKTPVQITIEKDDSDYLESVIILNTKSASLPITGGIGTLIFTFSGIALMGAAALLYIRSRRKKATEI